MAALATMTGFVIDRFLSEAQPRSHALLNNAACTRVYVISCVLHRI